MSEHEVSFEMPIPRDNDGFIRRACPTCEREFKLLPAEEEADATPPQDGGLFCPYCGVQAPVTDWWTEDQLEHARAIIQTEVVDPALKDLADSISSLNTSGPVSIHAETHIEPSAGPEPLFEPDDMVRVDFPCHPGDPLKVQEGWSDPVRCLICGTPKA